MRDVLIHCSDPRCSELIYISEAVRGSALAANLIGHYCIDCAHSMGYWSPADIDLLEFLLARNGLIAPIRRRGGVRHYQGQGVLEL